MSTIPVHTTTVQKQGDGSYIVRVIHHATGASTDVVFPYTTHSQELAEEYAAWKLTHAGQTEAPAKTAEAPDPRNPANRVSDPFGGKGQATAAQLPKAPTAVHEKPNSQALEPGSLPAGAVGTLVDGSKVTQKTAAAPEKIKVPVPAGDHNPEVEALEEHTAVEEAEEAEPAKE
jgi:hypothetical protein